MNALLVVLSALSAGVTVLACVWLRKGYLWLWEELGWDEETSPPPPLPGAAEGGSTHWHGLNKCESPACAPVPYRHNESDWFDEHRVWPDRPDENY